MGSFVLFFSEDFYGFDFVNWMRFAFFFFTVGWLEIFEMHLLWAKYIPLP
jgi:hypothetical protein